MILKPYHGRRGFDLMETSIQLPRYIIDKQQQQAKTNRVGFGGVGVKATTQKDMIQIRQENAPSSVLVYCIVY